MANLVAPPHVETLIDRQMKLWEVRRRLADEGGRVARREMVHLRQGPWLSVSRQFGAGGTGVARLVAESLGWQVFHREIVNSIARDERNRERILARLDERAVGAMSDWLNHLLVPGSVNRVAYVREVMEVMWAVARQGRAVLLGRGANWLLDPCCGLRVRVVAPLAKRVAAVAASDGIDQAPAERRVRETDDRKAAFIRQVYGESIDDPLGYDLVVNTGDLEPEAATKLIVTALREKLDAR
jgi:cytidylate kinase